MDDDEIKDIDDSIEFFIWLRSGSFLGNIFIFIIFGWPRPYNLLLPFLFRSSFSTLRICFFGNAWLLLWHSADRFFRKKSRKNSTVKNSRKSCFSAEKNFYEHKLGRADFGHRITRLFNIFLEMGLTFMIVPSWFADTSR